LNLKKYPLNFSLKFSTLILTKHIQSHFLTVTETLNSDKSNSNHCYSESESSTAHCSPLLFQHQFTAWMFSIRRKKNVISSTP